MANENPHKTAWLNLRFMMANTYAELEKARITNDISIPNVSTQLAMINKIAYYMQQLEIKLNIPDESPDSLII